MASVTLLSVSSMMSRTTSSNLSIIPDERTDGIEEEFCDDLFFDQPDLADDGEDE